MSDCNFELATKGKYEGEEGLMLLITHFAMSAGVVDESGLELHVDALKDALLRTLQKIQAMEARLAKVGRLVDIFWERQGWYIVEIETGVTSVEHPNLDLATKSAAAQGYIIRDIRRTRGLVPQPKPLALERKSDAE